MPVYDGHHKISPKNTLQGIAIIQVVTKFYLKTSFSSTTSQELSVHISDISILTDWLNWSTYT